jgi:hypothetical protein
MLKKLCFILLLPGSVVLAQKNTRPTPFDRFVNKPGIVWAAYASDTFNFNDKSFNYLLLNRFAKNEIKASLPGESRTNEVHNIKYISKDAIDVNFYGSRIDTVMDESGNPVNIQRPVPQIDTAEFKITEVTQILYIEKGLLKSYIPFVTPALPVYLSTGRYIGERLYFNTGYHYKYNGKPRQKNKLVFLSQTKKMIRFDADQKTNELKSMYGNDLIKSLWPYVMQNKIPAYAVDKAERLKPEDLNMGLVKTWPIICPVYDHNGSVVKYQVVPVEVDPGKYTSALLIQDWYYDHKKNKLYSSIKEMILYIKKDDKDPVPFVRLVLNQ